MAKYINMTNNSKDVLTIELIPKTQASAVRFKDAKPLNYKVSEDGTYSFSLATKLIDRCSVIMMPGEEVNMVIDRINGFALQNSIHMSYAGWSPDNVMMTMYDHAQLGLGAAVTYTNGIKEGAEQLIPTLVLYNTVPNQTITYEGIITKGDNTPGGVVRNPCKAFFNDEDLTKGGLINDADGNFAICLGTNNKGAGTELSYVVPIIDPDNTKLTGDLYLSMTVQEAGLEDITLSHKVTVTRLSNETPWEEALDHALITTEFVNAFNTQYAAVRGEGKTIISSLRDGVVGAPFTMLTNQSPLNAPNAFLPMQIRESLDGTWVNEGPIHPPIPSVMAASVAGSMDGSMSGSMDGSMDGSMINPSVPQSPYLDFPVFFFVISGMPLVDIFCIGAAQGGISVDNVPMPDPADVENAIAQTYELISRTLVIHTANPEEGEPLAHLAHNAERSSLGTYGTQCVDFRILSAGKLLQQSYHDLMLPPPILS